MPVEGRDGLDLAEAGGEKSGLDLGDRCHGHGRLLDRSAEFPEKFEDEGPRHAGEAARVEGRGEPASRDLDEEVRPGPFAKFAPGVCEERLVGSGLAGETLGHGIFSVADGLESGEGTVLVADKGTGDEAGGGGVGRRRRGFDPPVGGAVGGRGEGEAKAGLFGLEESVGLQRGRDRGKDGDIVRAGEIEGSGRAPQAGEMGLGKKGPAPVGGDRLEGAPSADDEPVARGDQPGLGGPEHAAVDEEGGIRRGGRGHAERSDAGFTKLDGCRCLGNFRKMLAAILTTFLFACSAVTGQRVAVRLGGAWGNLLRLGLAAVVLGLLVLVLTPDAMRWPSFQWFFVSGLIGFGLGDVALFTAYERIGSRLTILLNLCLAPLFAMALEWVWLGNGLGPRVVFCAVLILAGVVMAIRPGAKSRQKIERRGKFWVGIVAAVVAGFGQGTGAVISRKAEAVALELGAEGSGITAAFQRVLAGLLFSALAVLLIRLFGSRSEWGTWRTPLDRKIAPWLIGAALFGPVVGVSCFQWALQDLESGIVLAVVALTPIVMMPLARITEGDHPSRLALLGAAVAVGGVVLLNLWA